MQAQFPRCLELVVTLSIASSASSAISIVVELRFGLARFRRACCGCLHANLCEHAIQCNHHILLQVSDHAHTREQLQLTLKTLIGTFADELDGTTSMVMRIDERNDFINSADNRISILGRIVEQSMNSRMIFDSSFPIAQRALELLQHCHINPTRANKRASKRVNAYTPS